MTEPIYEYVKGEGWVVCTEREELHPYKHNPHSSAFWYIINEKLNGISTTSWYDMEAFNICRNPNDTDRLTEGMYRLEKWNGNRWVTNGLVYSDIDALDALDDERDVGCYYRLVRVS